MTAVTEPAGMSGPAKGSERAGSGGVLPPVSAEFADAVDERLVRQLAGRAVGAGLSLTGEGGLLQRLTKIVLEGALEGEMDAHLGYARHDPAGGAGGGARRGAMAGPPATAGAPRPCSPASAPPGSRCRGTGTRRLSRGSWRSGTGGWPGSMTWWSRWSPRA